jgi:hypothetical protein
MWKKSKCLAFLICFSVLPLFAHNAVIEIEGEHIYKAVRLAPLVYNAAHRNLSDLLIKDENGENVPYFINSSLQSAASNRETYPMMLINSYLKDDYFFFDYRLAFPRDSDIIATSLEFTTRNSGFAKQIDVFGSYDNINWEFVQSDILYVVESKSKLAINFNRPQKYTHYRLRLANNMERISFAQAALVFNQEIIEETYFIESFIPRFTVENEEKRTKITIEGLKNLRLCDLQIETGSMFIRSVSAPGGIKKELYNLSVNDTSYTDTVLPLNRQVSQDEKYIVFINNGDDKPIEIAGITVRYFADDLVFQGSTGSVYSLEFGADLTRPAPVYDIKRYSNEILKGPIDRLALGEISFIQPAPERKEIPLRIIFNIVVTLIALLLGVLIVLKLKK